MRLTRYTDYAMRVLLHLGAVGVVDLDDGTGQADDREDHGQHRDGAEQAIEAEAEQREQQRGEHELVPPGGAVHLL